MPGKKILWLCSWYPSKLEPFNGDFIQRHAQAASLFNEIYVIHVIGDNTGEVKATYTVTNSKEQIKEQIIYYKKQSLLVGRILGHYRLIKLYKDAIKKYIIEFGIPDLVHVHVPMKAGILALWVKKKYKIPFLLSEHWGIYNKVADKNYFTRSWGFKAFTKAIFREAEILISVSRFLAEGVNKIGFKKEFKIIPNVVDTSLFYYKKKRNTIFRFIHVSNMVPLKNAEGILRAFKLLLQKNKHVELHMIGDKEEKILQYALALGLQTNNIVIKGEVAYNQVALEMQNANCLVLYSNIENSPCVIGEALACGLPVIATKVGGIPELINETNGLLIAPNDDEALAETMLKLKSHYSIYNVENIAAEAKQKFSYTNVGKKIDSAYEDAFKKIVQ